MPCVSSFITIVTGREGAVSDLYRAAHDAPAAKATKLAAPYRGALRLAHSESGMDGALVGIEAWAQSRQLLATRAGSDVLENTSLLPLASTQTGGIEAIETQCAARDGARVPISILMRPGLKRDGTNPTLLLGYGGYGMTETARFDYADTYRPTSSRVLDTRAGFA